MRERQGREQYLQGNVMSGVVVESERAFFLCLLSLSEFLLSSSNWVTAWWIVTVAPGHTVSSWPMLQVVSDFFRLSLNRFFEAPLSQWPVRPEFAVHDDLWKTSVFNSGNMTSPSELILQDHGPSMLETSACSRTSTLVMKSLQWMLRSVSNVRACEPEPEPEPRAYFVSHCVFLFLFFLF